MSRRLVALPAALLAISLLAAGCGDDGDDRATDDGDTPTATRPDRDPTGVACEYTTSAEGAAKAVDPPPSDATVGGQVTVTFETTVGTFTGTLDADKTPCTVNSFVSLADQNYFNGTGCHRMTTDGIFVLQCGDPTETGRGGPGYTIPDEVDGSETYEAGTLAMANTGQPNSGGSQFFIVYDSTPLPPSYTVFGQVDEASVDLIKDVAADGTTPELDGAPNTPVELETVVAD